MISPPRVRLGQVVKDVGVAGEFEAVLRAQIASTRAEFQQAREAGDLELVTSLALRLRYLVDVATDSGVDVSRAQVDHDRGSAGEDAKG